MGLFSKKKKQELPQFPRLPEKPSFPEYKQQMPSRPRLPEIEPEDNFQIPIRRPDMPRPMPVPPRELAPTIPSSPGPQPLFVKIDRYKAAINALNEIKTKLSEAEATLSKLNAIKIREADEIARWENEISVIKERLMVIDKQLFEV